ncbi:MAG: hypothetical protein SNJ67_11835 [Chloracidobacterium sp.]
MARKTSEMVTLPTRTAFAKPLMAPAQWLGVILARRTGGFAGHWQGSSVGYRRATSVLGQ